MRLALLADPHLHPVGAGAAYGHRSGPGLGGAPFLRSLRDSRESTRVFNESGPALAEALRQIAAEGIGLCLIAGDLTDDGQPASWAAVAAVLAEHRARHGTRFLACPGNHDQWALTGKPLEKEFVAADGSTLTLSGAASIRGGSQGVGTTPLQPAPGSADGPIACPGMRMAGYAEALAHAGAFGYLPQPGEILWETPFGRDPALAARMGRIASAEGVSAEVPDLSYLVEPEEGLWVLSLDANVYLPRPGGGFDDCGKLGWSAALAHKPWLLPWITAVVKRARALGKRLIAMSHYPMVDIFSGTIPRLDGLGAPRAGRRRMPRPEESAALAATGLRLHLSGHWHVDAVAAAGGLVNLSLPSPVGFPAGWKLLELEGGAARLHDRPLRQVPGFDLASSAYRAEAGRSGQPEDLGTAPDYGTFLDRHFANLVRQRRLAEDWPAEMAALLPLPLAELPGLSLAAAEAGGGLTLAEAFLDWYRLREAGGGDAAEVPPERRALYKRLARQARAAPEVLQVFLETLALHCSAGERASAALAALAAPEALDAG